jgi:hypothetical protein
MSSAALAWLVTWTWQAFALTLVSTAVLRFALGSVVVLLGQTSPVVTVGAAAALPVVTGLSQRLGTDPRPLLPLVASGRVGLGTGRTKRTGRPMARTSREGLSPPSRIVNQARLLEHAEFECITGAHATCYLETGSGGSSAQTGPEIERAWV